MTMKPEYITPACFGHYPELLALQSTRLGGESTGPYTSLNLGINTLDETEKVLENTRILALAAGFDASMLVSSDQVHGTSILVAEKPGRYTGHDAFITGKENLYLCIYTADCYPVLLYDPANRAVGAAHAGWKGTAGGIVMKTLEAMHRQFGTEPGQCIVWIGTGISAGAYEVGPDVAEAFHSDCCAPRPAAGGNEKYQLDLSMANYLQLLASGVREAHIERSPFCTFRDSGLFYSWRRDNGVTGRMASIIGLNKEG
jgi:polyphenol oxidase